ncbi:amidohydrolase [Sinorhizobium meliloti]|uniref:amidohydrolase family protein n=1 Tax=Rhizobium meliloti TaxID=382 RepID=UPI000FD59EE5|nr:amidohydrolase family protein [Sinorhizobium meliloti]RVE85593.1 amidohydrolase [Sinorhizobium meliloti]RVG01604.1 amidohydrolase [Sinorhizobium meliloti]
MNIKAAHKLGHLGPFLSKQHPEFLKIFEAVNELPIDDAHCHLVTDREPSMTPKRFLERMSLAAMDTVPAYFPAGIYDKWLSGDEAVRYNLNMQFGIQEKIDGIIGDVSQSIYVKFLVKEMAQFLNCEPNLEAVMEARNDRTGNYWDYLRDLLQDVGYENVMVDTGYCEGASVEEINRYDDEIHPCRMRRLARIEMVQKELFPLEISFEEYEQRYTTRLLDLLDGNGNYGKKSYGMKSYLLPYIGLIEPLYDREVARESWRALRESYHKIPSMDRQSEYNLSKDLRRYNFTLALEECLKRDISMQIHTGDGEAPSVILRNQDPFYLEEVCRFDRDGVMRMPKIVPLHAGYPSVGKAAWLSHLYPNCYFELSVMTPFVHQNLFQRYMQVMEVVPLSKILYASDAFHVPELYWLAGRWGKRYLAKALTEYVVGGSLDFDEAIEGARMILYKNNRSLYKLD